MISKRIGLLANLAGWLGVARVIIMGGEQAENMPSGRKRKKF
jgi:hypothetical protein